MNKDRMKAIALLIGWVKNGVLLYGSISILAKKFGVMWVTMSHLWVHAGSAHAEGLIVSLETTSQKKQTGMTP